MKKAFIFVFSLVLGVSACQIDNLPENLHEETVFNFTSVKPNLVDVSQTKTEWNGETITWSVDDQIRMAYTVEGVWQGASDNNTTPKLYASQRLTEATDIATFTVNTSFTSTAVGSHVFYGLYPGSLVSGTDFSGAPVASVTIPAEQTPAANSFDAAADMMLGVSEPYAQKPSSEETVLLTWTRKVAHAQLTLKNLPILTGEEIISVTLTAQQGADLVGLHSVNLLTGEISNPQGTNNEVTILANNLSLSEGNNLTFWASFLPVTLTDLTVTVETDKAYYSRSFNGITRQFQRNKRNVMGIGMSSANRTAKAMNLVDYEESFNSGLGDFTITNQTLPSALTYVWTHDNQYHYAKGSAYKSGTRYEAVSYLTSPELTIGSTSSKLTFDHAANQLSGASFDSYFSVVVLEGTTETPLSLDVKPAGTNWTFVSSTVNLASFKDKTIRIAFKYTSTTNVAGTWEVKNFKVTDVKVAASPELSFNTTEFNAVVNGEFTAPGLNNPHNLTVSYESSNSSIASVDATSGVVTIGSVAGVVTITASFAGNSDYQAGSASYSINVTDPSVVDYVTLDWDYAGGTSAALNAVVGVETEGLGSDYAESNHPYRVKFDNTGDFIQVKTDTSIDFVALGYKMFGSNTSYLNIFESTDGHEWSERIDRLVISGSQNSTGTVTTTAPFNSNSRYVKIVFEKGSNVGIGAISIHKPNNSPVIVASDINNVPAYGVSNASASYQANNFTDDVEVESFDGCVTDASASNGTITYSVGPNYATTAQQGSIVLRSAANHSITTTINVSQARSTLAVSNTDIVIPSDVTTSTFTVYSAEFGYNATVIAATGMNLTIVSGASGDASNSSQTVTISSSTSAPTSGDPIVLGTIQVYRNGNNSDPQLKEITIYKAVSSGSPDESVLYMADFNADGEHRPSSSTNSFANNSYIVSNVNWSLQSADITTTGSPLEGAAHLIARNAKKTNSTAYATTENVLSSQKEITRITFLSNRHTNATLTVEYSIDGGTSWNTANPNKDVNVDTSYGYSITLSNVITSSFRLRFSWSSNNTTNSNRDSKLDKVIVYGK